MYHSCNVSTRNYSTSSLLPKSFELASSQRLRSFDLGKRICRHGALGLLSSQARQADPGSRKLGFLHRDYCFKP